MELDVEAPDVADGMEEVRAALLGEEPVERWMISAKRLAVTDQ